MAMELGEISAALKVLISEEKPNVRMVVQTGYDETSLVATASGYLRLAQVLVDFVLTARNQQTETISIDGVSMPTSSTAYPLFQANPEIAINNIMLASSEDEVKQIAEYYLWGSPLETKEDYQLHMSLSESDVSPREE